jgi:hypothetical protein
MGAFDAVSGWRSALRVPAWYEPRVSEQAPPSDGAGGDGAGGGSAPKSESAGSDVVLIRGVTEDGKGLEVLRARDERLEIGQVRPLEEGKPLAGDVVRLRPRPEAPFLCDVETQVRVPSVHTEKRTRPSPERAPLAETRRSSGPPQVASDAYRKNWDAIWSARDKKPSLPN